MDKIELKCPKCGCKDLGYKYDLSYGKYIIEDYPQCNECKAYIKVTYILSEVTLEDCDDML